jgi:ABC-2 type transport system ATP-binding protein
MICAAVLEVAKLHKKYGSFVAVESVSFRIHPGEVYGLLGPNGAGKSSTIKVLSCLAKPDGGTVSIDGLDIVKDQSQVKTRIGIVPQDIALYDDFSARENLLFFGRLYGMGGAALRSRADELLGAVGLLERANDHVGGFSGGMKRRINIAAGLMHSPKILYLDEPTVGIDPQSRRLILDLVKRLNLEGLTVLFTTHYMEEAEELCHRIGIIDFGKIIAEGTIPELRAVAGEVSPIEIELRDEPTEKQLVALKPHVESLNVSGAHLSLLCADSKTALPLVLQALAQTGARVHHLEMDEPDLETVFLKLTGRRLRD